MSSANYTLLLFHETPKALLVGGSPEDRDTDKAFWLPKSQVKIGQTVMKGGIEWAEIEMPDWLAEKCDLCPHRDGEA